MCPVVVLLYLVYQCRAFATDGSLLFSYLSLPLKMLTAGKLEWLDPRCGLWLDFACLNRRSHLENSELKAAYVRLQESYRELEQMKDSLENTKAACQLNLTDAQKESEQTHTEVVCHNFLCYCWP